MANNMEGWLTRAKDLLAEGAREPQLIPFAVSMLAAVYGERSPQLNALNAQTAEVVRKTTLGQYVANYQARQSYSAIENAVAEIEGGLVTNLRAQVAGEVLSELVTQGKETLNDGTEAAKIISAVLISAAFEGLMRRMGSELAGVTGRPDLQVVVTRLKEAQILQGAAVGTAQSYLKFRNDTLHADWEKVDRPVIQSCAGFIEGQLLEHFS